MTGPLRSQIFGDDAATYDAARPSYPAAVFDLALADDPVTVLEVGCGTGKASVELLARGVDLVGIEPDERMAAVARRHGVDVVVTRFEDWTPQPVDAIVSAQAWHWVEPLAGARRAGEVLPAGGRWTAWWNRERGDAFTAPLLDVYDRLAPHLAGEFRDQKHDDGLVDVVAAGFAEAGGFEDLVPHHVDWQDELTVARLVDRFSTHSSHRLLDPAVADAVHAALTESLGGADRPVTLDYTTLVLTTVRR